MNVKKMIAGVLSATIMSSMAGAYMSTQAIITSGEDFVYGDVNEDKKINVYDSIELRYYILGQREISNISAADLYSDGVIDIKDVITLNMYLTRAITSVPVTSFTKTDPNWNEEATFNITPVSETIDVLQGEQAVVKYMLCEPTSTEYTDIYIQGEFVPDNGITISNIESESSIYTSDNAFDTTWTSKYFDNENFLTVTFDISDDAVPGVYTVKLDNLAIYNNYLQSANIEGGSQVIRILEREETITTTPKPITTTIATTTKPATTTITTTTKPVTTTIATTTKPITTTTTVNADNIVDTGTCGAERDNISWVLDNEGTLTISGKGDMMNLNSYLSPWSEDDRIKKVVIKNGVTSIGERAFYLCRSLTSIIIPDSVTSIGKEAFSACTSLTSITIPDSVIHIGSGAFSYCIALTRITIPDGVTYIDEEVFGYCTSLTSITIPKSIESIGEDAFAHCSSLLSITIENADCEIYDSGYTICNFQYKVECTPRFVGVIYGYNGSKAQLYAEKYGMYFVDIDKKPVTTTKPATTKPATTTTVNVNDIVNTGTCGSDGDNLIWTIDKNGILTISGKGPMENWDVLQAPWRENEENMLKIKKIVIEDGVTTIGCCAFADCEALTSITIPDSVIHIGSCAFSNCAALTSITIPEGVLTIDGYAFSYCISLTSITIPEGVRYIVPYMFYNCEALTSITIPESVTSIGSSAFYDCEALTSITIPDSVTYIGKDAFSFCKALTSITISDSVTHIGENAFYMSDLDSIIIENPECTIFWDEDTIPYLTKIYGYIGSRAQDYAVYFNRYFVELEKKPETTTKPITTATTTSTTTLTTTTSTKTSTTTTPVETTTLPEITTSTDTTSTKTSTTTTPVETTTLPEITTSTDTTSTTTLTTTTPVETTTLLEITTSTDTTSTTTLTTTMSVETTTLPEITTSTDTTSNEVDSTTSTSVTSQDNTSETTTTSVTTTLPQTGYSDIYTVIIYGAGILTLLGVATIVLNKRKEN